MIAVLVGLLALAAIAALVAEVGLFSGSPGLPNHPDALTTLALVLAILAFLVQIVVFIFQTSASSDLERRTERLNAQTHAALGEIKTESAATQRALTSQFQRLLDYVVGGPSASPGVASGDSETDESQDVPTAPEAESVSAGEALTISDVQRIVAESVRPRPSFAITGQAARNEDEEIRKYLRQWPDREEAEAAVAVLKMVSPLGIALLTRYATLELRQRVQGRDVGLTKRKGTSIGPLTRELIDKGLVKSLGSRTALTDHGRDVVRVLPLGQSRARPDWFEDVTSPISGAA